jgi:hypothetical protein
MTTLDQIVAAQQRQVKQLTLSGEQRVELRSLRKEVLELRVSGRNADPNAHENRVQGALARAGVESEAESKVVAIKPPQAIRERLLAAQKRLSADTYRHIVMTALELGIEELERGMAAPADLPESLAPASSAAIM